MGEKDLFQIYMGLQIERRRGPLFFLGGKLPGLQNEGKAWVAGNARSVPCNLNSGHKFHQKRGEERPLYLALTRTVE